MQYAAKARNIENKPVQNVDKTQLEIRRLKFAVKTWMTKALPLIFPLPGSTSGEEGAMKTPSSKQSDQATINQLMQNPAVLKYIADIDTEIDGKLKGAGPTPRKVRLSLAPASGSEGGEISIICNFICLFIP